MKLSEVIKAIEDGSDNRFLLNGYTEKIQSMRTLKSIVIGELAIPLNGWEELKPPRQWSEKELMLFKLLPDWVEWISKDGDDGSVFVFNKEPVKIGCVFKGEVGSKSNFVCQTGTIIDDFLTITFEESPIYIGNLKNV